jgi:Xaa-Pro aminopeptidase
LLVERVHAETRRHADRFGLAAELLRARGLAPARLGTDVPVELLGPLVELLPEVILVAVPDALRRLRMVKTGEELARLRRCVEVAEEAISATVAAARPGVTQRELARVFNEAVAARSARTRLDNVSVGTSTALGNVNVPDDVLRAGDVIRFDVGATLDGYCSDLSRCFTLEPVAPKAVAYHGALVAGQQAALDVLRPDVEARELFSVAVDAVRDAGIPHYERTNVGHGIGIAGDGYDAPLLAPGDHTALEPGMVLCVETPYYELGFAGLQVEDMVVVRESGFEALSELPRELVVVG